MLRAELLRAFKNWLFVVAVVLGLACLGFGFMEYLPFSDDPGYLSQLPPFFYNAYEAVIWSQNSVILFLVPIVAVLPFADSLVLDRQTGYLRSVLTRTSYKRYLGAKFVACLLSGGVAVALPLLLLFVCANVVLPRGLNMSETTRRILSGPNSLGPFGTLYHTAPDIYILSLVVLGFVFGATYSIFGLSISVFANNRYVVLATPWLFYFIANFVVGVLGFPLWSPGATFSPHWLSNVAWVHLVVGLGGLFLASAMVFWFITPKMKARV